MPFFSVTWRIENFSMCAHKVGEELFSPQFTMPELSDTKWNFSLYPRGDSESVSTYISFYIERKDKERSSEITLFYTKLSIVDFNSFSEDGTFEKKLPISPNKGRGYPKLISHEKLYNPANGYLPNDTLTIHLYICPVLDDAKILVAPDTKTMFSNILHPNYTVEKSISKDGDVEDMPLGHCSFLTRIPVEKKALNWVIKEFSAKTKSKEKMSAILESGFQEGVKLKLVCYVKGSNEENRSLRMDIFRKGMDLKHAFVKCEVSVLDGSDAIKITKKSEHVFSGTYERWSFSLIDELSSSKSYINDDSLKLKCDFVISYEPQHVDYFVRPNGSCNRQQEIGKMLEDEETSDVSLESQSGTKFLAHKFLLFAKSPVFRAMFSSDTLEKQTGVVRMQDIDTDTVRHLRNYLYSDSLPDLEVEDVLKLYSAADKYQIGILKKRCSTIVKCNMDLENVCEILTKADEHQDRGLKDYATDYVIAEMDFDSDLWLEFMKENLPLAAEIMRQYCVRKRDT